MHKIAFVFCFAVFFRLSVSAQTSVQIWGDNLSTPKMKRAEFIVFKAKENPSGISVIVCPGGSYEYLGKKEEGYKIAKWLNENNITAFVLFYRVGMYGNRYPAMIQDLQRTIQLVKENSEDYGIDPDKTGVMGFSAGGHLAGIAGTFFDKNFLEELGITPHMNLRPSFVSMIYPVVTMTNDSIVHKRSRKNLLSSSYSDELAQMMSLECNVRPDMPPVFLVHCKDDKTVDYRNTTTYVATLQEKGVSCFFKLYNEPGHGFGVNPKKGKGAKEASRWTQLFIPWLENTLRMQLITETSK